MNNDSNNQANCKSSTSVINLKKNPERRQNSSTPGTKMSHVESTGAKTVLTLISMWPCHIEIIVKTGLAPVVESNTYMYIAKVNGIFVWINIHLKNWWIVFRLLLYVWNDKIAHFLHTCNIHGFVQPRMYPLKNRK